MIDSGEPSTTTDAYGRYTLKDISHIPLKTLTNSPLLLNGGTDTGTGKAFIGHMAARLDEQTTTHNITPLTTLANAMLSSGAATSLGDATQKLGTVLGINPGNVTADPMTAAAQDPAILQKTTAIQKAIEILIAAETGQTTDASKKATAAQNVATAIAQYVQQIAPNINPADPATLPSVASLITNAISRATGGLGNPVAVQSVTPAAAEIATITENTVAALVATLLTTGQINSTDNIANLIQANINTGIAGLADLQTALVNAAHTAPAQTASNPGTTLSVLDYLAKNPNQFGNKTPALKNLVNQALATATVTVTNNTATQANNVLAGLINPIESIKVNLTPATPPTPTPTPTPYIATTDTSQTATNTNMVLPAGFTNITVINSNTSDGTVIVQATNGSQVINISATVGNKDAQIYGLESYKTATNSTLTNASR